MYVFLSTCLYMCLSNCLSACLSEYLSVCLYANVYLLVCLSISLSVSVIVFMHVWSLARDGFNSLTRGTSLTSRAKLALHIAFPCVPGGLPGAEGLLRGILRHMEGTHHPARTQNHHLEETLTIIPT